MILGIGSKIRLKTKDQRLKTFSILDTRYSMLVLTSIQHPALRKVFGLRSVVYGLKEGFTLIEVMLAVSILAIGIIGVLRGYAVAVNALGVGQETIDAVCLLKEKITELERTALEEKGISTGISSGEFKDGFEGYKWELEVKSSPAENLNEVMFTVSHKDRPRKLSLVTYVENKQ